jgi:hypothetical protein
MRGAGALAKQQPMLSQPALVRSASPVVDGSPLDRIW